MVFDVKAKFNEYLHQTEGFSSRLERLYDEFESGQIRERRMIEWLLAAYQQGAHDMAQDTVDTLGDYATAVAGIEQVVYTREAAFDAAKDNLMVYYIQVLDEDIE